MYIILGLIVAYLLGTIPFGLLLAKNFCKLDPREHGSGNIGATNVARTCGKEYGIAILALDILKGIIAVVFMAALTDNSAAIAFAALAAVAGHIYPVWLGFAGGKGVATFVGAFLTAMPGAALPAVFLTIAAIFFTGWVSLGSLVMAAGVVFFGLILGYWSALPAAVIAAVVIFYRHRENILRMARGEENKLFGGVTATPKANDDTPKND